MLTARNGDVVIAYQTIGPPTGVPLLLICGNATQMIHWPGDFLATLVERGFQVTRFDNRDSGHSTHCAHLPPYDLRDMASDAVEVLVALGWDSAHVLGISLGGMIGQVMAVDHPDRVRSLTSMASAPAWSLLVSRPRLRTLIKIIGTVRRAGEDREAVAEQSVQLFRLMGSAAYPLDEEWVRDVSRRAYDIAYDPAGDQRQQAACKASGDRRPELTHVRVPTLIVHGEDDPLQSVRAGRATAQAIPGARLVTFPEVGHGLVPAELWPRLLDELCAITGQPTRPRRPNGR